MTSAPRTIRLAIAGVGNCASSLVQGLEYYANADPNESVPGLMHVVLGGYHIRDIEVVAAFDVDATKVGLDVGKAILAGQNNTMKFADVPDLGVPVLRGPTLDGLGKYYRQVVEESPAEPVDVAAALRDGPGRRPRLLPAGRAPRRPRSTTRRPASTPASPSSTPSRCSSPPIRSGRPSSRPPGCRSSATTSRARSAPPSSTASSPACSRTAAWSSTAPTSSTWAGTWTS